MKQKRNYYQQKVIAPKVSWKTIFLKNSGGISSKRVCGILGWFTCVVIFVLAFAMNKEIPEFSDMLVVVSASLLGVDSITSIFNKSISKS